MAEVQPLRPLEDRKPTVHVSTANRVRRLILDAPPANALSLQLMEELHSALESAREDRDVNVVVIGAVGRIFSGGHDLKELTLHRADPDGGKAFYEQTMQRCADLMQLIVDHPKPVIAEVAGLATAAGCQLVASCDLAIASTEATFCTPGVNIGLFCSTPMVALTRAVSRKQAMEMLLTGETIEATEAREFGLVNRVVPPEYLNQIVTKYAEAIASKSPLTVKIGKEAFYHQAEMKLSEAYDYTARVMVENLMARDAEEGINAFIAKRKAEWTGE